IILRPEYVLFIVLTVLPLLFLIVIFFTRPRGRRLIGALMGGLAFAMLHITWDSIASFAGWWHFTAGIHAPLVWYLGSLFWGACTALMGWRIQRRFGVRGIILFLVSIGVLGTVNDYVGMAVTDASHLIVFGPGIVPVLADT